MNFTKAAVSGKIETELKIIKNIVENYIVVIKQYTLELKRQSWFYKGMTILTKTCKNQEIDN